MFKNPLKKYQQGGQVSQEQQQMLAAFVEWLPKRVKEFQGMQPEQIVEALNGMTKSPEGQKQVQAYMQQFQQEMQNPQAGMFENGGKLQDFICKHAKGGHVAGCGCKEDGGKVEKHQQNNGMGRGTIAEQDGFSVGKKYWTNNADGSTQSDQYAVRPNGVAVRQRIIDRSHMLDRNQLPVRDTVNVIGFMQDNGVFAPDYNAEVIYGAHPYFQNNAWSTVRREEDGGVVKGQNSIPGGMPEIPEENKIYSEKNTMVKGPSIGQRLLGVRRPWLTQTVSFNPFSAKNDTTYTGRNLEAFIPGYGDDLLKRRYSTLPTTVKKNLANVIDSDYEEYNSTYGSYPDNYYEKIITVKKRK